MTIARGFSWRRLCVIAGISLPAIAAGHPEDELFTAM